MTKTHFCGDGGEFIITIKDKLTSLARDQNEFARETLPARVPRLSRDAVCDALQLSADHVTAIVYARDAVHPL